MSDALLPSVVVVLIAMGGLYAATEAWWRRTHPKPPPPDSRSARRRRELDLLIVAEAIVADRYQLIADLYETPAEPVPAPLRVRADR